jgi:cytoskeletal protein RodZ
MANPSGGGQSRLFLVVVLGLVGLLMAGLVAIAGLVVYTRFLAPTASPTTVALVTPSPRATVAATATVPPAVAATSTPVAGAPTPTRVIQEGTPAPEGATPTVTATPQGGGELAPTGFGPLGAVVGGVVLVLIILAVRRLRLSAST